MQLLKKIWNSPLYVLMALVVVLDCVGALQADDHFLSFLGGWTGAMLVRIVFVERRDRQLYRQIQEDHEMIEKMSERPPCVGKENCLRHRSPQMK